MPEFTRSDPQATADPRHLATLLSVEKVDIDKEKVIVHGTPPADAQAIIDAYVYDPNWGKPAEETSLKDEIAQRLQALDDATRTKTTWDGLTAAQRQEVTRQTIQGFVRLVRFIAKRFFGA